MAPTHRVRRLLTPSLLALALAIGTVSGAVGQDAAAPSTTTAAVTAEREFAAPNVVAAPTGEVLAAGSWTPGTRLTPDPTLVGAPSDRSASTTTEARTVRTSTVGTTTDAIASAKYSGRNHLWMPSLRIDRSVTAYACSRKSYPGNRVYRWGCAGKNNVYLFGHAHSVFKPLHDAYVNGRLKKGAKLYYADSSGRVHTYKVSWWKLTTATKGTWAYAPQAKPSLTLQTCVGSRNQYRLIVRLTEVG